MFIFDVDARLEKCGYIKQAENGLYVRYKKLNKHYDVYHTIEIIYTTSGNPIIKTYLENRYTEETKVDILGTSTKVMKLILKKAGKGIG